MILSCLTGIINLSTGNNVVANAIQLGLILLQPYVLRNQFFGISQDKIIPTRVFIKDLQGGPASCDPNDCWLDNPPPNRAWINL